MMNKKKSGLLKFVAGIGLGVGLGMLFAPKKGEELRKDLKGKLDELLNKAKEIDIKEVAEDFKKKVENLKEELADLDKEKVLEIAKEKADAIKEKALENKKKPGNPLSKYARKKEFSKKLIDEDAQRGKDFFRLGAFLDGKLYGAIESHDFNVFFSSWIV